MRGVESILNRRITRGDPALVALKKMCWGYAIVLFEQAGKMTGILVTDLCSDGFNEFGPDKKQLCGYFHFSSRECARGRFVVVFLENAAEVGFAHMHGIGKVPQRTQGCKVPLDVFEALLTECMACAARRSTQGLWRWNLTEDELQQLMTGLSLFGLSEINQLLEVGANPG